MRFLTCVALVLALSAPVHARRLLVISVDGLDHRYLKDCDALGLKIPNMRRIIREGLWADGVIGVMPTVTWPSHTTLITGADPSAHGILSNRRPQADGGEYYWSATLLKVPTLLDKLRARGRKTAGITWPVTVDAPVDFNLPEYFRRRNGGAMDLRSIESKATPGLVDEISKRYPSFAQEWMNDRTRTLATLYVLQEKKPDLILLHLVDHDSEAHSNGPFTREAKALIEYSDDLIGQMMAAIPKDMVVALVSDHGFERIDKIVHLGRALEPEIAKSSVSITPHVLIARTPEAAGRVRTLSLDPANGIGREIPRREIEKMGPPAMRDAVAAWEPAEHVLFGAGTAEPVSAPTSKGGHGYWPGRPDYKSTFALWGAGVSPGRTKTMHMIDIAAQFKEILELDK